MEGEETKNRACRTIYHNYTRPGQKVNPAPFVSMSCAYVFCKKLTKGAGVKLSKNRPLGPVISVFI
jgi:hypothetical protein